jgi:hypothetical protein
MKSGGYNKIEDGPGTFGFACTHFLNNDQFLDQPVQVQAEDRLIIEDLRARIGHIYLDRLALDCLPPPIAANENYIRAIIAHDEACRFSLCMTTPSRRASSR